VTDTLHITGRLTTVGRITTCEDDHRDSDDSNFETVSGILIEMSDANVRAAATLIGKDIEVRLPAASMPACDLDDRASIVAFLNAEGLKFLEAAQFADQSDLGTGYRLTAKSSLLRTLAAQIARADDRNGGGQ